MSFFKDKFSKHSGIYQKFRPDYPESLFSFLSSLTPEHNLAWDAGTGNGQAAKALTRYFNKVYATDPSEMQIRNAFYHKKIIYKVETSEHSSLSDNSVDLITVAQALHWFDIKLFYSEVKRVLKPQGIIAVWTYNLPKISPEIDAIIKYFHDVTLGPFWQSENQLVAQSYDTVSFPFNSLETPSFTIEKNLSFEDVVGLIRSWSALQLYIQQTGTDPLEKLGAEISNNWGSTGVRKKAIWNITLQVGRNFTDNY